MDIADEALRSEELDLKIALNRHKLRTYCAGHPGECEWCGEHSPRIVRGACAKCRDELNLDKRLGVSR